MRSSFAIASLLSISIVTSACKDEAPTRTGPEPMRAPPSGSPPSLPAEPGPIDSQETGESGESGEPEPRPAVVLPERPRADPDIDRALDLISASGLRFVDQADEPDERPDEYTAEQFAAMLRTKWDWLGYDLTELEPWLDAIATRSFKTNLPYRVVLADGTTGDLRPWLDQKLRERPAAKRP